MYKFTTLYILLLILVAAGSILLANQSDTLQADILPAPTQTRTPEQGQFVTLTPTDLVIPESIIPTGITHTIPPEPLTVRVESVNIHAQPELSAQVIGWLHQNDQVFLEMCADNWVKLRNSGYVMGTCFEENPCGETGSCQ